MRKKLIGLVMFACVSVALLIPAFSLGQQRDTAQQGGKGGKGGKKGGGADVQFPMPGGFGGGGMPQGRQIDPAQFGGFAQGGAFGGIAGGKGGKGGKGQLNIGGMNVDMNGIFDALSKGQDSLLITNSGQLSIPLQQWARDNGNTSGYITRQQFNTFAQSFMSSMQANFGGAGGKGGKGGKGGNPDAVAEQRFKSGDKNQDGFLSPDEMSGQLRDSGIWKKYDRDGNGVLNLDEYKTYWREYSATLGMGGPGGKGNALNAAMMVMEEEWDQRPVVFRVGKLPSDIPGWFIQLDADKDAQVGLYEWRVSQKPLVEFQVMDRNGDSLLTAEEVLWHLKSIASLSGPGLTTASYSQAMQGMNGFQNGPGFGKGPKGGKKGGGPGGFPGGGPGGGGKKGGGGGKKGGGGGVDFSSYNWGGGGY